MLLTIQAYKNMQLLKALVHNVFDKILAISECYL